MNIRMNTHRSSKSGCEHVINHKNQCVDCDFSFQILEKLVGTGYDNDGLLDSNVTKLRQIREDFWIKRLRTLYPYGLNEKAFDKISDSTEISNAVGKLYPPLDRNKVRPVRTRRRDKSPNIDSVASFFNFLNEWFLKDLKQFLTTYV